MAGPPRQPSSASGHCRGWRDIWYRRSSLAGRSSEQSDLADCCLHSPEAEHVVRRVDLCGERSTRQATRRDRGGEETTEWLPHNVALIAARRNDPFHQV